MNQGASLRASEESKYSGDSSLCQIPFFLGLPEHKTHLGNQPRKRPHGILSIMKTKEIQA